MAEVRLNTVAGPYVPFTPRLACPAWFTVPVWLNTDNDAPELGGGVEFFEVPGGVAELLEELRVESVPTPINAK
jgi:hypothetical protein